jgi:uncharacterized integral membrane protein
VVGPVPTGTCRPSEGDPTMLWTILVILAIVALAIFIANNVRGRRKL